MEESLYLMLIAGFLLGFIYYLMLDTLYSIKKYFKEKRNLVIKTTKPEGEEIGR